MSEISELHYFDVNADAKVHPLAWEAFVSASKEYANASSSHSAGKKVAFRLEVAREKIAKYIHAKQASEIIFTSGGTESNALGICGVIDGFRDACKPHVLCLGIEHPSVYKTLVYLAEKNAIELELIPVSRKGFVDVEQAVSRFRKSTKLLCLMLANNETGVLQPVAEITKFAKKQNIVVLCDAVQALSKVPIDVQQLNVDLLSMSAHKVGGMAGIGALFVKKGSGLKPLLVGGGQEYGLRASTSNVAGASAFAAALSLYENWQDFSLNYFEDIIQQEIPDCEIIGKNSPRLPNTSCICFHGCDADGIMMSLDLDGFALSTGSACSTGSIEPSVGLMEMGLTREEAKSCVRFSFSRDSNSDAFKKCVMKLKQIVLKMRS